MLYTKQQLIDAYAAATGTDAADILDQILIVQAYLDSSASLLQDKIDRINTEATSKTDLLQTALDSLETDAKTEMKKMALTYLADLSESQSIIDNEEVSL